MARQAKHNSYCIFYNDWLRLLHFSHSWPAANSAIRWLKHILFFLLNCLIKKFPGFDAVVFGLENNKRQGCILKFIPYPKIALYVNAAHVYVSGSHEATLMAKVNLHTIHVLPFSWYILGPCIPKKYTEFNNAIEPFLTLTSLQTVIGQTCCHTWVPVRQANPTVVSAWYSRSASSSSG